jgi:hypothetical protein
MRVFMLLLRWERNRARRGLQRQAAVSSTAQVPWCREERMRPDTIRKKEGVGRAVLEGVD